MVYERAIPHECPLYGTNQMPACANLKLVKETDEAKLMLCSVMRCPVNDRCFQTELVEGFQNE